jgi:hypothetical protein
MNDESEIMNDNNNSEETPLLSSGDKTGDRKDSHAAEGESRDTSYEKNFNDAILGVFIQIHENTHQHRLAAEHFTFRQFWFFTFSQAVLTLFASVLAFVTDPESRYKNAAGALSCIVVFLQTMSGNCNYGTRAAMHEAVVIDLRNLKEELDMFMKRNHIDSGADRMQREKSVTADDMGEDDEEKPISSFGDIESRFRQSVNGCKSMVPNKIIQAYTSLSLSSAFLHTHENQQYVFGKYGHNGILDFSAHNLRSYLASEFTDYPLFPMFLPQPSRVLEATMNKFRKELQFIGAPLDGDIEAGCC